MDNITELFCEYLISKAAEITPEIMAKASSCLQDYMSVAAAGARKNKEKWAKFFAACPKGKADIFGYDKATDSKTAALINGFNAHSLELDDGHRFAMIHLGASIISAITAARADFDICEQKLLKGIIVGYEAACRLSVSMQPSHKKRGYHASGTCGTIGSAVGTAFALGMDKNQLKRAITAAAASAAGMLEIQSQSSEMKPYNLGRAAMDGLTAAYMGLTLFLPPDDIVGGERGFLRMFSNEYDTDKLLEPNKYFEIERIYVKPYASCRHSHSAVEAAINLHQWLISKGYADNAADIVKNVKKIIVNTYLLGVKGHDHIQIYGTADAKLSTPYAVAAALLYGRCGLNEFDPVDTAAAGLAKIVEIHEDPSMTEMCPQKRAAKVILQMQDGNTKSEETLYAKGEPENPLGINEMEEKKRLLSEYKKTDKI